MLRIKLKSNAALPAGAPSIDEIEAIAARLSRDLENFTGMALLECTRLAWLEGDTELYRRLQAAVAAPAGMPVELVVEIVEEPGDIVTIAAVDALARSLGVGRDRLMSLALAVWAVFTEERLNSPEVQAYWKQVEEEVARLPEGYTTSM